MDRQKEKRERGKVVEESYLIVGDIGVAHILLAGGVFGKRIKAEENIIYPIFLRGIVIFVGY